jgi:hypothetical protein
MRVYTLISMTRSRVRHSRHTRSPIAVDFPVHQHEFRYPNTLSQDARFLSHKLPKLNFTKFDGDNPMLCKSRCENYFDMYLVDASMWVQVAIMNFEGAAARWLQSVDHHVCKANWSKLCSWIHDCFDRDSHEILIRQLFKIKQTTTVQEYIDRLCELVDQPQLIVVILILFTTLLDL